MTEFDKTNIFINNNEKERIHLILVDVIQSIKEKGYDPVNQILGYIKTNNLIYIPRDNSAREKISKISNDEILEYLLYYFIKEN